MVAHSRGVPDLVEDTELAALCILPHAAKLSEGDTTVVVQVRLGVHLSEHALDVLGVLVEAAHARAYGGSQKASTAFYPAETAYSLSSESVR